MKLFCPEKLKVRRFVMPVTVAMRFSCACGRFHAHIVTPHATGRSTLHESLGGSCEDAHKPAREACLAPSSPGISCKRARNTWRCRRVQIVDFHSNSPVREVIGTGLLHLGWSSYEGLHGEVPSWSSSHDTPSIPQ